MVYIINGRPFPSSTTLPTTSSIHTHLKPLFEPVSLYNNRRIALLYTYFLHLNHHRIHFAKFISKTANSFFQLHNLPAQPENMKTTTFTILFTALISAVAATDLGTNPNVHGLMARRSCPDGCADSSLACPNRRCAASCCDGVAKRKTEMGGVGEE